LHPFQPVFAGVYRQGDPGSGIGGYDLLSPDDRAFAFDYLHSGTLDHLVLYRPGSGAIFILRNNHGLFERVYSQGAPGKGIGGYDLADPRDRMFPFDYEHSGRSDYLVAYRPGTGTLWILQHNDGEFSPVYREGCPGNGVGGYDLNHPNDHIFAFDYNHSGCSDHLFIYRQGSTSTFEILKHDNGEFAKVYSNVFPGVPSGVLDVRVTPDILRAIPFDYTCSGLLDHVLYYHAGTASVRILENKRGALAPMFSPDNQSVELDVHRTVEYVFPYDYDGKGKADHLVYYWPGTGSIAIFRNDGGTLTVVYENTVDELGIGGYDLRSGRDRIFPFAYFPSGKENQLCLYRPGTGTFWILRRF
jgi:hypothetical protein